MSALIPDILSQQKKTMVTKIYLRKIMKLIKTSGVL